MMATQEQVIEIRVWHFALIAITMFILLGTNGKNGLLGWTFRPHDEVAKVLEKEKNDTTYKNTRGGYTNPLPKYSYLPDDPSPQPLNADNPVLDDKIKPLTFPLQPTRSDLETGGDNYIGR